MPVSATASTMALVDSTAASYLTCSRCPTTSAVTSSMPLQRRQPALEDRRFLAAAQALDAEHRLGVQRAARADRRRVDRRVSAHRARLRDRCTLNFDAAGSPARGAAPAGRA